MRKCRISNTEMDEVFSLGDLYISDFLKKDTSPDNRKADLTLCFSSKSKLLQLKESTSVNSLYGKYWYRSGINSSMRTSLKNVVDSVMQYVEVKPNDVWLDIASNDGTLLSFVPKDVLRIGIDPAEDSYKNEALHYCDDVIQDYFSAKTYQNGKYGDKKAKVVTVIAMFYDLDAPEAFLRDIQEIMADDGILVLQLSYTPLMINQLAFDNICHEHVCYYSLTSLDYLVRKSGFRIVDCELNDVNGGSFRVYIQKNTFNVKGFKTAPFRDVADFRIQSLLQYEDSCGFNTVEKYVSFYQDIQKLKQQTIDFVREEKNKGKKIWGYGASTKGNTLLQWFGLDHTLIEGIAERSPYKYGLKTVGTNIPIYSEEDMRKNNPDYLLILPWHFVEEFKKRESSFLNNGGAFIVPCPRFTILF